MRFALYFAPDQAASLAEIGCRWLGRDALTNRKYSREPFPGIDADRLHELTRVPRRYGLHATLKPPFRMAPNCSPEMLISALSDFTCRRQPILLPPLKLRQINDFFCLCPEVQPQKLNNLAAACVRDFDHFRAPLTSSELARRRGDILSPAEKQNLLRWGYPYVFDQFIFHITLTARITNKSEKEVIHAILLKKFKPILEQPVLIDAVSLFIEPAPGQPLYCTGRFPLSGTSPKVEEQHTDVKRNHQQDLYSRHQRHTA